MAVMRVNKTGDYTVISNTHFREKDMSLKAKGLLSLMLSLPDDWDYSIAGLVTLSKDGKDSVMNALTELEQFKYLNRSRVTNEKGQFAGYVYDIYEKPYFDTPQEDIPYAGNPNTDNPPQLNTKTSNTEKLTTKKKKESKKDSFDKIINDYVAPDGESMRFSDSAKRRELLQEWLKVRKAKRAAMTDRAIQMNIDKLDNYAAQSNMTVVEYLEEIICRGWAAFYVINNYGSKRKDDRSESNGRNNDTITDKVGIWV